MSLAVVRSRSPAIASTAEVSVEVHLANGLPSFSIVGLPDLEVRESRERVRAALLNCGFEFPTRRITVNLAPADLPKESGRFDLPIALGILAANGKIPMEALLDREFAGELSLTGALRPMRGAFALACGTAAAAIAGSRPLQLYLPAGSAAEAALVPGVAVYGATDLPALCAHLAGATDARLEPVQPGPPATPPAHLDLDEVHGQHGPKRALEIAAAGAHHLLMVGPPGSGKSMLAARLPGIMPPMTDSEALESAAISSTSRGGFNPAHWRQRPFRAPHHSSSAAALVGGRNPPQPGEVTLAHLGVLFLDELPEYDRRVLEMLREPLEVGHITISRAAHQVNFPAACQLIAAMNPCPCGWLGDIRGRCRCTPDQIGRYRRKLSGPLLDRIDLQIEVAALEFDALGFNAPDLVPPGFYDPDSDNNLDAATCRPPSVTIVRPESSAMVAVRVAAARKLQFERQGVPNGSMSNREIDRVCHLDAESVALMRAASQRFGWSARAHYRVLKVSRTIADLSGAAQLGSNHVAEAIQYRRGLGESASREAA
jgi:magnesium chelatase family protein